MWSFSNNSRTKLSSQPLSRAASSLCPHSRQGLRVASLWHSSGHSTRPAWFLLPAMSPRGSLLLMHCPSQPLPAHTGAPETPSLPEAVSKGMCPAWVPCGRETLTAPHSAHTHSSFAPLLPHSSLFLGEPKYKFSMVCPGLGFFHPHF